MLVKEPGDVESSCIVWCCWSLDAWIPTRQEGTVKWCNYRKLCERRNPWCCDSTHQTADATTLIATYLYWFSDSETNATRVYDIPMLSGSAIVGQLYDGSKDQLIFEEFLWSGDIAVTEEDITSVKTDTFIEESVSDRYEHLGVSAQLAVSLYSGLIDVSCQ